MAAVCGGQADADPSVLYCEAHWADERAGAGGRYARSKTLAERAAWAVAAELPALQLAVVNPSLVLGPPVPGQAPRSSNALLLAIASGAARRAGLHPGALPGAGPRGAPPSGVCHVDDVVDVHVAAAEAAGAAGQRYAVTARDQWSVLEIAAAVARHFPALAGVVPERFADGVVGAALVGRKPANDCRKAERLLGRPLRDVDAAVVDGVRAMFEQGLLGEAAVRASP
jgi:nucleoside-diphosphate-sugar epimerase